MHISHTTVPRLRLAVVVSFIVACILFFGYLWTNMGGTIPGVTQEGYRVSFQSHDVDNLVYDSDVMVAGVRVGKVRRLDEAGGTATVVVQLDDSSVLPLHEGVQVHLRAKSLIEETYVEIADGSGPEIAGGTTLPPTAVVKSVQLDDVLASLDEPTRKDLGASLRSLGEATGQTSEQLDQTMTGLGVLGRDGHDVLDALEAQSEDLQTLVRTSTQVMGSLDEGQGRIVDLVDQAAALTTATADNRTQIEATVRKLPGVLGSAKTATAGLTDLSTDLRPLSTQLAAAAPSLNQALVQLPATTKDLRGLMPSLNGALDLAPETLGKVPTVAGRVQHLVPTVRSALADVNPALAYLEPYGPDLAAMFSTWNAMLSNQDVNGHFLRIFAVLNEQSVKGVSVPLNHISPLDKSNAYPQPGGSVTPGPFTGTYPRVGRDAE
jgi:phospholipid/cholesterol/gamma-HCH transport system substrate-binding protein